MAKKQRKLSDARYRSDSGVVGCLEGVGTDAGFAAGEGVAGAVERFVIGVAVFAEGAECFFAGPSVDGEVGAGDVGIAEELGAAVVGRGAEELRPGALVRIGGLEGGNLLLGDFELPDNNKHMRSQSCHYGSAAGIEVAKMQEYPSSIQRYRGSRFGFGRRIEAG